MPAEAGRSSRPDTSPTRVPTENRSSSVMDRELRRRTLDAVRESYITSHRKPRSRWLPALAISPRLIGGLAACVLLASGFSLAVHQGGPELIDAVRNAFTQPVLSPSDVRFAERPASEAIGLPVGDEASDALARDEDRLGTDGHSGSSDEPARAGMGDHGAPVRDRE